MRGPGAVSAAPGRCVCPFGTEVPAGADAPLWATDVPEFGAAGAREAPMPEKSRVANDFRTYVRAGWGRDGRLVFRIRKPIFCLGRTWSLGPPRRSSQSFATRISSDNGLSAVRRNEPPLARRAHALPGAPAPLPVPGARGPFPLRPIFARPALQPDQPLQLVARVHAQLGVEPPRMAAHGVLADDERLGDVGLAASLG